VFSASPRIWSYTARPGMPLPSYSFTLASDTSAPILRTRALSAAENLIASPPPSITAFLPGTSSESQAWPTSASLPVTVSVTSFFRSGGSFAQKSSFIPRPKLVT